MLLTRFEPSLKPEALVVPDGQQLDMEMARGFFGALPGFASLKVVTGWNKYVQRWGTISPELKKKGCAAFWSDPMIVTLVGSDLCKLGVWYSDHHTSNMACERLFGIMRAMESPQRYSLTEESVRQELMAKNNSWLVDELLVKHNATLKK
jgi:hypothetical protein